MADTTAGEAVGRICGIGEKVRQYERSRRRRRQNPSVCERSSPLRCAILRFAKLRTSRMVYGPTVSPLPERPPGVADRIVRRFTAKAAWAAPEIPATKLPAPRKRDRSKERVFGWNSRKVRHEHGTESRTTAFPPRAPPNHSGEAWPRDAYVLSGRAGPPQPVRQPGPAALAAASTTPAPLDLAGRRRRSGVTR